MQVDGHVVCDWARKSVLQDLTCANKRCVTFCNEIVVKDRVLVWLSEESVGSIVG